MRPGEKYAEWELRGVPLRIVVGMKDLERSQVTVVRRVDGAESTQPLDGLAARLPRLLEDAHRALWERARRRLDDRSLDVRTLADLATAFNERAVFASGPFCARERCETAVKDAVHALTVRVLRSDREAHGEPCVACGEPAEHIALMARAY
jgi:prolyl-tRNA synthetase